MRVKKSKSISSVRPLSFMLHSCQLRQEGTGWSHIPISPIALPQGRASPNWTMNAVGKTLSVKL